MECLNQMKHNSRLDSQKRGDIYESVRRAIMQLNVWLNSIEEALEQNTSASENDCRLQDLAEDDNRDCRDEPVTVDAAVVALVAANMVIELRNIYNKMNLHQSRLTRIVCICEDLSSSTSSSQNQFQRESRRDEEFCHIHEYIVLASSRFSNLHSRLEKRLRQSEQDSALARCNLITDSIRKQAYELDLDLSSANQQCLLPLSRDVNTNNHGRQLLSNVAKDLCQLFERYSEKVEHIRSQIMSLDSNSICYSDFSEHFNGLETRLCSLEAELDQQQNMLEHTPSPTVGNDKDFLEEQNSCVEEGPLISISDDNTKWDMQEQSAQLSRENLTRVETAESVSEQLKFASENLCQSAEQCTESRGSFYVEFPHLFQYPIQQSESLFKKDATEYPNLTEHPRVLPPRSTRHYLHREVFTVLAALSSGSSDSISECSQYQEQQQTQHHNSDNLKPSLLTGYSSTNVPPMQLAPKMVVTHLERPCHLTLPQTLQHDSLWPHTYSPLFVSVTSQPPDPAFVRMLNISTKILNSNTKNVDDLIYRHIMAVESLRPNEFSMKYSFLTEETFSDTLNSILVNYRVTSSELLSDSDGTIGFWQRLRRQLRIRLQRPLDWLTRFVFEMTAPKHMSARKRILNAVSWFVGLQKRRLHIVYPTFWNKQTLQPPTPDPVCEPSR